MKTTSIESICIFGSCARGSIDSLSDRDVLIICGDFRRRVELEKEWRTMNWSVASYCPSRFERLVEAGSLFVQHLRHEGLIYRDTGGWLAECLASASPNDSYSQDAANSVLLATPIERFRAEEWLRDTLVAADLAYVAVRNFGVCHLADRGKLCFDYSTIVTELGEEFGLGRRAISLLSSLRTGKVAYRDGDPNSAIQGSIGQLRETMNKLFVKRPLGEIKPTCPTRWLGGGYAMLRDFEAAVLSNLGHVPNAEEIDQYDLNTIWDWVRNPRRYSWGVRNLSQQELEAPIKALQTNVSRIHPQPCSLAAFQYEWPNLAFRACTIKRVQVLGGVNASLVGSYCIGSASLHQSVRSVSSCGHCLGGQHL